MKWSFNMTKAEFIRFVREKLLMTQSELSKACGIPLITLSRWESGSQEPQAKQWGKFMNFCSSKRINYK